MEAKPNPPIEPSTNTIGADVLFAAWFDRPVDVPVLHGMHEIRQWVADNGGRVLVDRTDA